MRVIGMPAACALAAILSGCAHTSSGSEPRPDDAQPTSCAQLASEHGYPSTSDVPDANATSVLCTDEP